MTLQRFCALSLLYFWSCGLIYAQESDPMPSQDVTQAATTETTTPTMEDSQFDDNFEITDLTPIHQPGTTPETTIPSCWEMITNILKSDQPLSAKISLLASGGKDFTVNHIKEHKQGYLIGVTVTGVTIALLLYLKKK